MSWPTSVCSVVICTSRRSARHAEVEDLRLPGLVDEDVAGLEVAVDHALLVGVLDGVADLATELQTLTRTERRASRTR
jgi:hypothetical protein